VRGFDRLLDFASKSLSADVPDHLEVMKGLLAQLMNDRPVYQCRHCGFAARSLHWQCPGCKHWNTVRPVRGVAGE
jgi:lipopolysaccharide biosynthesis regulator YciM